MAKENILKIGILLLIMVMITGPVSASGGATYNGAQQISVPDGRIEVWSGTFSAADWYRFPAYTGDIVHIDLQRTFSNYGGQMELHNGGPGNVVAWVNRYSSNHDAPVTSYPEPRIRIIAGNQFNYQFAAGLNC